MLNITGLNQHGQSGRNSAPVLEYLKATEYYRDKDGVSVSSSRWWGQGAAALGLTGSVDVKDMEALAKGFAPDGRALAQNAGTEAKWVPHLDADGKPKLDAKGNERGRWECGHRVGWDFMFSAPKPPSVLFAAASAEERDRIREAHDEAVNEALGYLEKHAETRRGKGGRDVISAKLVVSKHLHVGSRSLDPDLHTHALVYAVVEGDDGKWSALEPKEIYRQKMAAGAIYRSALARNLLGLGYGVEKKPKLDAEGVETGQVYFTIAGIDDHVCDAFSKRREALLAHMAKHGGSAQAACIATRERKEEPPFDELSKMWDDALTQMRLDNPKMFRSTRDLKGRASNLGEQVPDAMILERLHETEAVFTRGQLVERLALENVGRLDAAGIEREADEFLKRNDLVVLKPESIHDDDRGNRLAIRHREDRYADRRVVAMEQQIAERAKKREHDASVKVDKAVVDEAVKNYEAEHGVKLTSEQRNVVDWATQKTGGLCAITGTAGSGKTFTAGAWISAFEADGRTVIGAAVGWDAAKKLEADSGITSYSTRSLLGQLDRGKLVLTERSVVVLDEAGMAGTRTVARLQEHCDNAKAKLVVVGDVLQLQSPEAGSPFRLAIGAVGDAKLTEVRRQRRQSDKETTKAFYAADGKLRSRAQNRALGMAVLNRLEKAGQLEPYASQNEAIDALVQDHVQSATPDRDKLALAGTRADVSALNLGIRAALKAQGRLGGEEHTISAMERGAAANLKLSVGDRIRFGKRDRELDVVNGNVGVVEGFRLQDGRLRVAVRLESEIKKDEGRRVEIDTTEYPHLGYAYASTTHKAQGQSKAEVRQLAHAGMADRQLHLVAFTRTKDTYRLYGADDDIDPARLAERLGTDRLKTNASEQLKPQAPVTSRDRSMFQRASDAWKQVVERFKQQNHAPKPRQEHGPKMKIGMG